MPRPAPGPRIVIVGTTGSGKTALARDLARALELPHVELDALNWGPNWTPVPVDVFRDRVQEALRSDAWICEGNYRAVHDLVWPRAEELVWLDYPFRVVFPRLLRRTWRRLRNREILWAGNRESLRGQFTPTGILVWQARTHWRLRRQIPARLSQPQHTHLHLSHLRSPRQTDEWLAARGRPGPPTPE